jgi:hypothetical protein
VEVRRSALPRTSTEKVAKEVLRAEGITMGTVDRESALPRNTAA